MISSDTRPLESFAQALSQCERIMVLTGAGISQSSGIPTYRDAAGRWQRSEPIQHAAFLNSEATRQRYWARSLVGWPMMSRATPNAAHQVLSEWERSGQLAPLLTQNVDGLHQKAGQQHVIDLHGRIDEVICLDCREISARTALQARLLADNPQFAEAAGDVRPDGDAQIDESNLQDFVCPRCLRCGGRLKPHVVFFGDNVPKARVEHCFQVLRACQALLVLGSSLQVFSGFRFCRQAAQWGIPIYSINPGLTRADALLAARWPATAEQALPPLWRALQAH